jgi:hypothetical protein
MPGTKDLRGEHRCQCGNFQISEGRAEVYLSLRAVAVVASRMTGLSFGGVGLDI